MAKKVKLDACPFCGCEAKIVKVDGDFIIGCDSQHYSPCYCDINYHSEELPRFATKAEAIEAWNQRNQCRLCLTRI